jgi:sugar (pentulose or hexulose) kinase
MTADHILAIDNGTQSVRALIFDLSGNLVAKSQVALEPYVAPQPGWAEQDPDYYWRSLTAACRKLWATSPVPKEAIAGVALTTQRATVVNVDRQGKPLRPAIVWLDQRRTMGQHPLGGLWGLAFKLARMGETISYIQAEAEANWIRTHQPEVWAATHKYLFLSGYLTYRLTGRFADSVGSQVGFMPFDYKALRWAADWSWQWQAVPMRREMLAELVPPCQPLGEISRAASEETGIPAGLPLIAAAADKACEVIGSGALESHIGCLSFGTTATITNLQSKYIEPIPLIPPYPAAVPGAYNLEVQIYRGFWMVSWFKKEFGQQELAEAEEKGVAPEQLLDDLIRDVPPGSDGLVLQPYWSPGLKVPGPEAKGAVIGFSDVHTRAHLYRAILEGLVYGLREGKERIEARTGQPITELRVSGGGSQSDIAMQISADLFGLPAIRPHVYETSGLGAAINVAVGLGLHNTFPDAVRAMTRPGTVFDPNPATHRLYDALYRQVYLQLYDRLKKSYRDIIQIYAERR